MSTPLFLRAARLLRRTLTTGAIPFALAGAQRMPPAPVRPAPNDSAIRITLLTMGQGTDIYELFGHNAIWVHDPAAPFDIVYNWGVFDFRTPGFIRRFIVGKMDYIMIGETIDNTLAVYKYLNRRVVAQELDLTAAEKRSLVDFVRWNALPQNRAYRYDEYRDNCSTRVRDLIDRVTGGQLRPYLKAIPTSQTYRDHTLRLMEGDKLLVTGSNMVLGRPSDLKLDADEASFLPVQLMNYIRGFKVDGGTRPLVRREYTLVESTRTPEAEHRPALWKALLPIGLLLAALLWVLDTRVTSRTWVSIAVPIVAGLIGIVGSILTFMATATAHFATHANENIFMMNPLWLIVAVVFPLMVRGRALSFGRWLATFAGALSLLALVLHLIGVSRQVNWDVIGLIVPVELVIAAMIIAGSRRPAPPRAA